MWPIEGFNELCSGEKSGVNEKLAFLRTEYELFIENEIKKKQSRPIYCAENRNNVTVLLNILIGKLINDIFMYNRYKVEIVNAP